MAFTMHAKALEQGPRRDVLWIGVRHDPMEMPLSKQIIQQAHQRLGRKALPLVWLGQRDPYGGLASLGAMDVQSTVAKSVSASFRAMAIRSHCPGTPGSWVC